MGRANGIVVEILELAKTQEIPKFTYADVILLIASGLETTAQIALSHLEH